MTSPSTPISPDELTYEQALAMAVLCGFEFADCDWCSGESRHCPMDCCLYTMWGCCGRLDRENAVWAYLVLKGVITHVPAAQPLYFFGETPE